MSGYWRALAQAVGDEPAEARPRPHARFEGSDDALDAGWAGDVEEEIEAAVPPAEPRRSAPVPLPDPPGRDRPDPVVRIAEPGPTITSLPEPAVTASQGRGAGQPIATERVEAPLTSTPEPAPVSPAPPSAVVHTVTIERETVEATTVIAAPPATPAPADRLETAAAAEFVSDLIPSRMSPPPDPVLAQPPAASSPAEWHDAPDAPPPATEPPAFTVEIGEIIIRIGADTPAERPAGLRAAGQGRVASLNDYLARRGSGR